MIGPKSIFCTPLENYQNNEQDDTQCQDDFPSPCIQKEYPTTNECIPLQNYEKQHKNKLKKVKFNLNTVHCSFSEMEPAVTISKQVKKLVGQNPHLQWVNPSIFSQQQ